MVKDSPGFEIPLAAKPVFHRNPQFRQRHGEPASSHPSATGKVSSNIASLVKFRMAKLSIQ